MAITKVLDFNSVSSSGEPVARLVTPGAPLEKTADYMAFTPATKEFISGLKPEKNKVYVLVNAMGASEYYSCNVNGDSFPEAVLKKYHPTFVTNGKPFMHHLNKDAEKSYGQVLFSDYNDVMHRVELVIEYDDRLDKKYVDKLKNGELVTVSMGCRVPFDICFPAGTLVRTDNGYTPIESVEVGGAVRTHAGVTRTVTAKIVSDTSILTTLDITGMPELALTPNHPVLVVKKEKARACKGTVNGQKIRHTPDSTGRCLRCGKILDLTPEWLPAAEITPGDYVLTPVDGCADANTVGVDRAKILGYYVGDGHIVRQKTGKKKNGPYRDMGIGFTASDTRTAHIQEIIRCLESIGTANIPKQHHYRSAVDIIVYDQPLAHWILEMGGRFSKEKRLSETVFSWSRAEKIAFIGGYIDTDGCWDKNGAIRIATVNRGLALDTQRLLHSLGVPSSVVNAGTSRGGFAGRQDLAYAVPVYYIFIPGSQTAIFSAVSEKDSFVQKKWKKSASFFWRNYWCAPVTAVKTELVPEQPVYNLSVAEDESYIAEGIAVHNCSICMHKAESPDKYCDHLKSNPGLGRMLPDGRKAFAINTEPTFFDISIVTVPADPTARVLLKIASQKSASSAARAEELGVTKAAESVTQKLDTYKANKTINANDIAANFDPVYNELAQSFDRSMGPGIAKECLNAIGESSSDIFSTLKSLIDEKMFLRPQETQRIVLVACGKHDVADELDNAKITLGNDPSSVLSKILGAGSSPSILDMIPQEIRNQRSMSPDNVKRIIIRMHLPEKTASIVDVPVSDAYRELAGEPRIREEVPTILTNPLDALKSYLALGSIITAFNSLMGKSIAPGLLSAAGISALVGPQALYMMRKVDESVNRPSQRMVFDDRDSPENIERAIMSALAQSEDRLRQKLGGLEGLAPLSSKALLSIPLAFGASKLMSSKAKESAIEEAQITGKYEPGILSKQEWTFPLALGLILKYSSARKKVNEYIKTAEKCFHRPFPEILKKNEEDVYRALSGILFS